MRRERNRRTWGPTAAAAVAALAAAGLGMSTNLASTLVSQEWLVEHRGVVWSLTGILICLTVLLAIRAANSPNTTPEKADELVLLDLARAVRRERLRFIDQAMGTWHTSKPAQLRFTNLSDRDLSGSAASLLLNWQALDMAEVGTINTIESFHRETQFGRLVILGPPGAGKTVLLSYLVIQLVDRLETNQRPEISGAQVPVLLSLTSLEMGNLTTLTPIELFHGISQWITERLVIDYQVPWQKAETLVKQGRVLPVLDGLDEMDSDDSGTNTIELANRPRALAVVRALNSLREPLILASRSVEYERMSQAAASPATPPPILTDARHVKIRPLQSEDVKLYLAARFGGLSGAIPPRWRTVIAAMGRVADDGRPTYPTLLAILTNPWQLFLAVTRYESEDSRPVELLDMTFDEAQDHLISALVPTLVSKSDEAAALGWTSGHVLHWLGEIARHQVRAPSPLDIQLADLWAIGGRRYPLWISAISPSLALLPFLVLWVYLAVVQFSWAILVIAMLSFLFTLFFLLTDLSAKISYPRVDVSVAKTSRGRSQLLRSIMVGIATTGSGAAVISLIMLWFTKDAVETILLASFGLILGMLVGGIDGLTASVQSISSPAQLKRQCLRYSLMVTSIYTIYSALGGAFVGYFLLPGVGAAVGLLFGPLFGMALGMTSGSGWGNGLFWLRYQLGVRAARKRGFLPRDPALFLTWGVSVGLVRMSGINIQFRHRQLFEWLLRPNANSA